MAGGDKGGTLGPFFLATSTNTSATAQLYNPASGTLGAFSLTTSALNTARESATSVVLPNGKVLLVGGEDCVPDTYFSAVGFLCTALNTAELYSETGTPAFTYAGSGSGGVMTSARSGPSATLIEGSGTSLDGQVLIVGGSSGQSFLSTGTPTTPAPTQVALNTAELYNPATDKFTAIASVPGCPAGESSLTTPACTSGLPATCPGTASVISSASETGTTVTINSTTNPTGLIVGDYVTIANVAIGGTV